ncbi:glycosyltransferase family 4 protein [Synechococcus sp. PCC 6312]|uniref:glycosyltransferase family 4 protein n=1 Tax=Synechococcus sp. (strain ATCC 27167 / PCC 6312) TaxID=195253 RepID=UPI00029F0998|nr:glycosyltransferase family 4 protein [Synechococcus sp. PCC 6312]AFY61438.1 glycosyltransferase [Synechococcus sp. PCC 6312]
MNPKILFWTQLFWPYIGGVEVLSSHFLRAIKCLGYDIIVVTSHGSLSLPNQEDWEGITIHRFPFLRTLETRDIATIFAIKQRLIALKQQFQPDLIHINLSDPSLFFHLSTAPAIPTLISAKISFGRTPLASDTLLYKALKSAHWVTANSQAILTELHQLFPPLVKKTSLIYNGLKIPLLAPTPLIATPPKLLCLGRVVPEKGFDLAIHALRKVIQAHPDTRLMIAGDGPHRPALERQVTLLGLTDRVEFLGWIRPDDVPALINCSTLVLMPSRWEEAFGLVALEAALQARPVIASRVGGLPEVVMDGEGGIVVEKNNPQALATAICTLLSNLPQAKMMGERARTRAAEIFGWERYVSAYDALYRKLCSS